LGRVRAGVISILCEYIVIDVRDINRRWVITFWGVWALCVGVISILCEYIVIDVRDINRIWVITF
jgi:hypothetical protein